MEYKDVPNYWTAVFLCVWLGPFGAHHIYMRNGWVGLLYFIGAPSKVSIYLNYFVDLPVLLFVVRKKGFDKYYVERREREIREEKNKREKVFADIKRDMSEPQDELFIS